MTFRFALEGNGINTYKIDVSPLLTHSRCIYGTPVETCGPYPRDYMSECVDYHVEHIIGSCFDFVNSCRKICSFIDREEQNFVSPVE